MQGRYPDPSDLLTIPLECGKELGIPGAERVSSDKERLLGRKKSAVAQFVGAAADHFVAGMEVAHHFDEVAVGRAFSNVHPFGSSTAIANDEGALGGRDHAGLGNEKRGA